METRDPRASILERALEAGVTGDASVAMEAYTRDVRAWSPIVDAESREDLVAANFSRFHAFSDVAIKTDVDLVGDRAYAEWALEATHTGAFTLDDKVVEPSGKRVTLRGVAVAEFTGDRISALRLYWDELELLGGLGLIRDR
jgi:hypothetical protein